MYGFQAFSDRYLTCDIACFICDQPLTMHLACVNLRMTMEESLVAATLNAAASLGRSHTHGSLERGKMADMLVINAPR